MCVRGLRRAFLFLIPRIVFFVLFCFILAHTVCDLLFSDNSYKHIVVFSCACLSFRPVSSDSRDSQIQSLEEKRGVVTREGRGGGGVLLRRASASPRRRMEHPSEPFYVGETAGGGLREGVKGGGGGGGGEEEDRECVICMEDFTKVRR